MVSLPSIFHRRRARVYHQIYRTGGAVPLIVHCDDKTVTHPADESLRTQLRAPD
jgi:hypothetical protein